MTLQQQNMKFIQPREVLFTRMVVLLWQIRQTFVCDGTIDEATQKRLNEVLAVQNITGNVTDDSSFKWNERTGRNKRF